jgi:(1->4)-alpha-D-glucan 1-alpha-D-glucosylmutase
MKTPQRVPRATYRLQLRREQPFSAARALLPYLRQLGISDLYLSPVSMARPGSPHGYDVVDHERLNPELGSTADLTALLDDAHALGMGVIFDVVPNHMCILDEANHKWRQVLEDGPSAAEAAFFDIDWNPPKEELTAKILLPFLEDQYGRVLETGLAVAFADGGFTASWNGGTLPLAPETWVQVLALALEDLRALVREAEHPALLELESVVRSLSYTLPALRAPELRSARHHEKQAIRRRLATLDSEHPAAHEAISTAVQRINGTRGDAASFDRLERLMNAQFYRLAHWRVAAHEINYRRFFDINELAAVRVENPAVFASVHALVLSFATHPACTGFRIDHLDGLADPQQYLADLASTWRTCMRGQAEAGQHPYVIVEKILAADETLRPELAADGTTGYDFMALAAGLLLDGAGAARLRATAAEVTGGAAPFRDVATEAKLMVLSSTLAAELTVLARRLDRISEQHRYSRDFTLQQLHATLSQVVASFPIYRTYVRETEDEVGPADARAITQAIGHARRSNPLLNRSLFEFLEAVLLHRDPPGLSPAAREARREFVTRFQQLTAPVFAKGIEDTAFYRYLPLVALNEVGGDPSRLQVSDADLHAALAGRGQATPRTLSATATHDSKRGEDARARLFVLSEVPEIWAEACKRWAAMHGQSKTMVDGAPAPDASEEYFLYQSMVAAWPLLGWASEPELSARLTSYMVKARHEAKSFTSYINPNPSYEKAAEAFVTNLLDPDRNASFLAEVDGFVAKIAAAGICNSLAQLVLKLASPGVPDFFQGRELWDFSLVDPDNRRPVDFAARAALLGKLRAEVGKRGAAAGEDWMRAPADGRIKLWLTTAGLGLRAARSDLFADGGYRPLVAQGPLARHVFGFAREHDGNAVIALMARHVFGLPAAPPTGGMWAKSAVELPAAWGTRKFQDTFTGRTVEPKAGRLGLEEVFASLPVSLLETTP